MPERARPTDRTLAWQPWRDRIAGRKRDITFDEPQPGFYKAKRNGQWVCVQIDLDQEIGEGGELMREERMIAFVGRDVFYDEKYVIAAWQRCCGNPITEAEAERLLKAPTVSDLSREAIV